MKNTILIILFVCLCLFIISAKSKNSTTKVPTDSNIGSGIALFLDEVMTAQIIPPTIPTQSSNVAKTKYKTTRKKSGSTNNIVITNNPRTLTIYSNYGSVNILTASNVNGSWSQLTNVTGSTLSVASPSPTLFFRAQVSVFNFTVTWQPPSLTNITGYNVYVGAATNKLYTKFSISKTNSVIITVSGTNISPTLFVGMTTLVGTNESVMSGIVPLQVPNPILAMH